MQASASAARALSLVPHQGASWPMVLRLLRGRPVPGQTPAPSQPVPPPCLVPWPRIPRSQLPVSGKHLPGRKKALTRDLGAGVGGKPCSARMLHTTHVLRLVPCAPFRPQFHCGLREPVQSELTPEFLPRVLTHLFKASGLIPLCGQGPGLCPVGNLPAAPSAPVGALRPTCAPAMVTSQP